MPLKFVPRALNSEDSMRLALLHMLRHEHAVILQTFAGNAAAPRGRPPRSLPSAFCGSREGAEGAPRREEVAPPQLPQLVYGTSRQTLGPAARAAEATGLPLPHPPQFPAERPPRLFLSLSLPHFDLPLVFAAPRRGTRDSPRARRRAWLPPAVTAKDVAATWEEMCAAFCAAWDVTVRVEGSPSPLPLPLPPSAEQPPPPPSRDGRATPLYPAVVPCRTMCRQQRRRERVPPAVYAAGWLEDVRPAFTAQAAALRRCFLAATRAPSGAAAAQPPPPPVVAVVDTPRVSSAGDAGGRFELPRIVVPPLPRGEGVRKALQQLRLQPFLPRASPQCMTRATELRFPDGKHVRQTLSLRNTAKERLQELCASRCPPRRRRRRRQATGWFSGGTFCVAQGRDLAAAALHPSAVLSAASHLRPPGRSAVKRRCADVPQPPPPPVVHVHAAAVFAPSTWQPLTFAAEENSDACGAEGAKIAPWRVFPREVELQTFQQLFERRLRRRGTARQDAEEEEEDYDADGEAWCHAAFLHDVHTMPLPYREATALIDDARLHYCYRLALHRERRRLGL
ncbi:uncharacterized protein Tco025E_01667 [Trypanosoma conorhini]|uniref:Uncharacterized protein n=1 Tax=Trypanosoma conorhini TaxID=83891 RepID=A0A422Q8A1_9TRYP|nr:uncharacterized protein Tco025E_01667 [Trypanosoma conorhini]RNF26203.1 hypothetical protein Tco025E_01667 [Trypanosoma conorhini]